IGPNWLESKDEAGHRRLHNPDDFVAIEIAAALDRGIRVIPVLVDGAHMPKAGELPEPLKPLARRQAAGVRNANFRQDAETLIARMRQAVGNERVGLGWLSGLRSSRRALVAFAMLGVVLAGSVGLWLASPHLAWQSKAPTAVPPTTMTAAPAAV